VKNLRSWLYPWSHEVWDLLAKVGDFPEVVPILIARRIHPTTFRMLKDIGALGYQTRQQWFAERGGNHSIDPTRFAQVAASLGFDDATLLGGARAPDGRMSNFFSQTLRRVPNHADLPLVEVSAQRWAGAAPLAADYTALRAERMDAGDRRELLTEFAGRVADAGLLTTGGWARLPDEGEDDEPDWQEL
jgi:hypothetical protein